MRRAGSGSVSAARLRSSFSNAGCSSASRCWSASRNRSCRRSVRTGASSTSTNRPRRSIASSSAAAFALPDTSAERFASSSGSTLTREQEVGERRVEAGEHLGQQELEERTVAGPQRALERRRRRRARRVGPHRAHRDAQSGRPALRAVEQAVGERRVDARGGGHLPRVVARELEVGLAELGEIVGRAKARERERRIGARVERHRPVRRSSARSAGRGSGRTRDRRRGARRRTR